MANRLGLLRGSLLVFLPLAAFFVGPALRVLGSGAYSALPLAVLLPIGALVLVPVLAHRWTKSVAKAVLTTVLAIVVGIVGVIAFIAAIFPSGH